MRFQREDYTPNLIAEMRPLLEEHNREIPQLGISVDPDWKVYKQVFETGMIRIFTARVAELLVGYQVFILGYHPHRRSSFEATQDVLYLEPEVRQGMVGIKFLKWCDNELKKDNVKVIHHPIDANHDFGAILKRMGYALTDVVYSRKLEVV